MARQMVTTKHLVLTNILCFVFGAIFVLGLAPRGEIVSAKPFLLMSDTESTVTNLIGLQLGVSCPLNDCPDLVGLTPGEMVRYQLFTAFKEQCERLKPTNCVPLRVMTPDGVEHDYYDENQLAEMLGWNYQPKLD